MSGRCAGSTVSMSLMRARRRGWRPGGISYLPYMMASLLSPWKGRRPKASTNSSTPIAWKGDKRGEGHRTFICWSLMVRCGVGTVDGKERMQCEGMAWHD